MKVPPAFTNNASATGLGTINLPLANKEYGTAFANVLVSALVTQVYTPTAGSLLPRFIGVLLRVPYGGETCEEFSNVIQIGQLRTHQPLGLQGGAITAPDTVRYNLCRGVGYL